MKRPPRPSRLRKTCRWARGGFHSFRLIAFLVAAAFSACAPLVSPPAPQKPAPATRVPKDFDEIRKAWLTRHTVDVYKKVGKRNPVWDEAAERFLTRSVANYVRFFDASDAKELVKEGKALLDQGCDDPLVLYWYGSSAGTDDTSVGKVFLRALDGFEKGPYPRIYVYYAGACLGRRAVFAEGKDFWMTAMGGFADAICEGEFGPGEKNIAYFLASNTYLFRKEETPFKTLVDLLRQRKNADPWILNMLEGHVAVEDGWKARGSGFANTVTPEGWKGFSAKLDQARAALTRAWEIAPEYPEAPGKMITVAMGKAAQGETPRLWFDRSVQAQINYYPSYDYLLWSMRPRWGGSHVEMLGFGLECLNAGRFDTWVPLFYLTALMDVACEMPADNWRLPFRQPGVQDNLRRLFEGYRNCPDITEFNRKRLLAQEAMTELWCGNYEKAREILADVPEDVNLGEGFHDFAPISWRGEPRKTIETEIRAFTGPRKEDLLKAEALQIAGLTSQSLTLFEQIASNSADDPALRVYLMERVAFVRMAQSTQFGILSSTPYLANALYCAVSCDYSDIARTLIEAGADVNWRNEGWSAISIAIHRKNRPLIEMLLNHGARVESRPWEYSPLSWAVAFMPDLVPRLLAVPGADAGVPDQNSWTPLHYALRRSHHDLALLMLDHNPNLDLVNKEGWAPLHLALRYGDPEVARRLIEMGADVRLPCVNGLTPLYMACRQNYLDLVAMIVQRGADLDAMTGNGDTALKVAVREGRKEVVVFLLKAGANPDARGTNTNTPLATAIYAHRPDMALDLIARGADVNALIDNDWRAIHLAAREGPAEVVEALLKHGADPTVKCLKGARSAAIDMARESKHSDIAKMLENWKKK